MLLQKAYLQRTVFCRTAFRDVIQCDGADGLSERHAFLLLQQLQALELDPHNEDLDNFNATTWNFTAPPRRVENVHAETHHKYKKLIPVWDK